LKLEAILFDLDNTLLMFKELTFFEAYSKNLYLAFRDIFSPDEFIKRLMFSTQKMIENDGTKTNAEFFIDHFSSGVVNNRDELWQRFETFYADEFDQFAPLMSPHPHGQEIILHLKARGMKLVIATNPMFPMSVQQKRLNWANLGDVQFDLVTSADNFNYCKPSLEYYRDIAQRLNVAPERCLMVGNDPLNDMVASHIGMKTFLTTDADEVSIELSRELAKNSKLELPTPDFSGPIREVTMILEDAL